MVAGSLDEGRRRCLALAADVAATAAAVRGVAAKSALAAGVARDISGGVRLLDGRKTRVERAIAAGDDVIKLRSCVAGVDDALQTDDLEAATKCVGVFREIESAAEAGGTTYELELAAMRHSAARVTEVVTERYFEATAARDDDSVVRWLTLLPLLGLVDAAVVDAYVEYWRCLLRDTVRGVIDAAIAEHATSLATLQRLINAIAAVAKAKLSASAAALQREQGGARLLVLANEAYEAAALAVLARFVAERRVTALAADARRDAQWPRAGNLGLDELDALLEDVATALQRLETWERFAWHSAASIGAPDLFRAAPTRLAEAAAELGGWYATLETRLLEKALDKAEQLDTTRDVACEVHAALKPNKAAKGAPAAALDDVATSSAADDAFYAARRCAVRALAAGYGGAAASVLVAANEMLTSHTLHGLSNRVHQALAAASAAGDFALCEDGDALDALGSTLARGAEDLASLSEDLAARSQELFGGRVNEPVRPKPQSVYAAPNAEEFRLHLVEAQVALNTLELACEAHLGRLREELAVELEESYPQAHSKLRQLEALVSELEPPRGGVAERFASALAAARDAFASAMQKPLGNALAGATAAGRNSLHRWALDEASFAALERSDSFGNALGRAIRDVVPRATASLSRDNAAAVLAAVAAAVARRFEAELRSAATSRAKVSGLGALQLDKDVRTLRALLVQHAPERHAAEVALALRNGTARLQRVADVLAVDDPEDAAHYGDKFGDDELKAILAMRAWGSQAPALLPSALEHDRAADDMAMMF